ncbi:MAG: YchF/TatD family DNA exonuclease [Nitrospinae bacterium]|nr:YchF/TatD family DNA exonuclease [Nitrospinota bacterium]
MNEPMESGPDSSGDKDSFAGKDRRGRSQRRRRRRGRRGGKRPEHKESQNTSAKAEPAAHAQNGEKAAQRPENGGARDPDSRRRRGGRRGKSRPRGERRQRPKPQVIIAELPGTNGLPVLVDTHAHLIDKAFDPDRQGAVERAIEEGVHYIISMGTCLESSRQTLDLAMSYAGVYAAVGVHPSDVKDVNERTIRDIAKLAEDPQAVAIGEIGLDYYREGVPRKTQRKWFREQIRLAVEVKKPIVVHCRDSADDVYEILEKERAWRAGGVIHCFTGDDEQARKFLDIDFHLGAGGAITFSRSEELREVFERIPIERVLLETDSPYLAPPPHRGKRNEPAYVARVAETLGELHGMATEEVTRLTTENVRRLFGVGPARVEGSVAYPIGETLYLNITNDCQNSCFFCGLLSDCVYKGHNLALESDPDAAEVLAAAGDPTHFEEVVFSGFGEPTLRLDVVKEVAGELKRRGAKRIRLVTNGLANKTHERNILPELGGLVDAISISMQAESPEAYAKVCKTKNIEEPYPLVKEFVRWSKNYIPEVEVTAVKMNGLIDIEACEKVATDELGVPFRAHEYVQMD